MIMASSVASMSESSRTIVVAMSGGVDSSVAAGLLCRSGYRVIGITLQLYDERKRLGGGEVSGGARAKSCCAGRDIGDARDAARKLGIPHYVLDFESRFQSSVIDDFLSSYRRGETPLPCVRCNQRVKFSSLLSVARDLGACALATGHYIRKKVVEASSGEAGNEAGNEAGDEAGSSLAGNEGAKSPASFLYRARDKSKDQSYFLFTTTREQLDFLRFPLGELHKEETRALAESMGLPNADKKDSQDICFVADRYTRLFPELKNKEAGGEICSLDGRVLGRHEGIAGYTIGQRRGLGLGGLREPLYVVGLDVERNRVYVGGREALLVRGVILRELNLLASVEDFARADISVKYRSLMEDVAARVSFAGNYSGGTSANLSGDKGCDKGFHKGCEVIFAEQQSGVSSGQACVFYAGERVLGGGIIDRTLRDDVYSYDKFDGSFVNEELATAG